MSLPPGYDIPPPLRLLPVSILHVTQLQHEKCHYFRSNNGQFLWYLGHILIFDRIMSQLSMTCPTTYIYFHIRVLLFFASLHL